MYMYIPTQIKLTFGRGPNSGPRNKIVKRTMIEEINPTNCGYKRKKGDGWMDVWMDRWMTGRMDGLIGGWMD